MTAPSSTIKNIGRGAIWSVFNNGLTQLLPLAVFLVTARFVSKEAFGVMAISILIVEGFRQIIVQPLGLTLVAKKNPADEDYNACFITLICISSLFAVLVFLLAPLLAELLRHPDIEAVLHLVSPMVLFAGLSRAHEVWLIKGLQFKKLAVRSIASLCAGGSVGIYMAVNDYGIASLIAQQIVTSLTAMVFLWASTKWRPSFRTRWSNIRELFLYTRYLMMSAAVNFLGGQADIVFSSYYLGAVVTGAYNAAKRILAALNMTLSQALNSVALPVFANIGRDDEKLPQAFSRVTRLTTLLAAPLYAGIFVLSEEAIGILLGENWLSAAPILSALIPAAYVLTVVQYTENIFLVHNKPQWQTILTTLNALGNIGLFAFVVQYGALYVAAAYSLRALLLLPVTAGMALYLLKMPAWQYMKQILPSIVAAIIMAAGVYVLKQEMQSVSALLRVALLVPVGAAIYLPLVILMDRSVVTEVRHILSQMLKKG